jgi:hypothetical protein
MIEAYRSVVRKPDSTDWGDVTGGGDFTGMDLRDMGVQRGLASDTAMWSLVLGYCERCMGFRIEVSNC